MNTPSNPETLLSLADVAARLPSPYPGKRTHLSTVYRLIRKHQIPVVRRGHFRFIREADLALLFTDEPPRQPSGLPKGRPPKAKPYVRDPWTEEVMRTRGLA